jgi:hypothetical protein
MKKINREQRRSIFKASVVLVKAGSEASKIKQARHM